MKMSLEKWREAAPRLSCDWPWLQLTYTRSLIDLAALRFYPKMLPGQALPAAGLPWFMTIFGRDCARGRRLCGGGSMLYRLRSI